MTAMSFEDGMAQVAANGGMESDHIVVDAGSKRGDIDPLSQLEYRYLEGVNRSLVGYQKCLI
jgi:hypothetical protein